jgi:hypothetical protein
MDIRNVRLTDKNHSIYVQNNLIVYKARKFKTVRIIAQQNAM